MTGAQCESAWCTVWHFQVHNVGVPGAQCGAEDAYSLQARQVLPGHRAAALLQNFLPLVCHLASAFCSNVHFQTIFSQISISSRDFSTHKLIITATPFCGQTVQQTSLRVFLVRSHNALRTIKRLCFRIFRLLKIGTHTVRPR